MTRRRASPRCHAAYNSLYALGVSSRRALRLSSARSRSVGWRGRNTARRHQRHRRSIKRGWRQRGIGIITAPSLSIGYALSSRHGTIARASSFVAVGVASSWRHHLFRASLHRHSGGHIASARARSASLAALLYINMTRIGLPGAAGIGIIGDSAGGGKTLRRQHQSSARRNKLIIAASLINRSRSLFNSSSS